MATTLIKIGNTDCSDNVVRGSYKVNRIDVYKTYEDANGATHRRYIRKKMSGTLQMFFKFMSDYEDFIELIDANKSATTYAVACTLYDNLSSDVYTVNAFIDFQPTITQDAGLREYMQVLDITIEER